MGVYKYQATKNITGVTLESIIYAETPEEALEKIIEMGYSLEKIEEINVPDRRVNERLEISLKVIFSRFKPGQTQLIISEGFTLNISSGGMLFQSERVFNRGIILDVELHLPEGLEDINCLCRVIRSDQINQQENKYNIAVCFLDLPNSERSRINDYITQQKR
ncbi:MAG: PilZ domain-containing protein [Candidatus Omnitrophica bacterium]|nr:PilZ domain-containing protein [Candidatus Omnitrophota bacterium]